MGYITFDQLKSTVTKLKAYIDAHSGGGSSAVQSVNGKTGAVTLDASDVGALPDSYTSPVSSVNGKTGAVNLTASDVGAKPSSYTAPVSSVNGQTGAVQLTLGDSVNVTQKQTSGTNIADIEINGQTTQLFAPSGGGGGSTVSVTQKETSGTNIADITVDGVTTQLFAPSGGGSSALPRIRSTAVTVTKCIVKDDADIYQPVFLTLTCDDSRQYVCFAVATCERDASTGDMEVIVRQLWGHTYVHAFGADTGTVYEIQPLLIGWISMMEYFKIPSSNVVALGNDMYEIDGSTTTLHNIHGQYGLRELTVNLTS